MTPGPYRSAPASFHLETCPFLTIAPLGHSTAHIARLRREASIDAPMVFELAAEPAYFVMLYLRPVRHCDLHSDGSRTPARRYDQGSICVVDISCGASIQLTSALDAVAFVLPFALIAEVTGEAPSAAPGAARARLRLRRNAPDPTLHRLGLATLPFFKDENAAQSPALPHIVAALCFHLIEDSILH